MNCGKCFVKGTSVHSFLLCTPALYSSSYQLPEVSKSWTALLTDLLFVSSLTLTQTQSTFRYSYAMFAMAIHLSLLTQMHVLYQVI